MGDTQRAAGESDPARRDRRIARLCLGLLLVQVALGIALPAGRGWDFANFYDAGRRIAAGQIGDLFDPESPIAGQPPQGELAFWSAPISALLYVPLAALPPGAALVAFKLQNTLALFGALAILFLFCRRFAGDAAPDRARFTALFAAGCLLFQPLWTVYRVGGQTTPTVLLLLSAALVWHVRGRLGASALCFAIAVLIKPALVTGLAFLGLVSRPRFAAFTALCFAAAAAISLAALGWEIHAVFLGKLLGGASATWPWPYNSSLYVLPGALAGLAAASSDPWISEGAIESFSTGLQLLVLALCGGLVLAGRSEPWSAPARRHFHFSLALLFALLVVKTVWEHYLALLFPFLAYAVAVRGALGAGARRLLAAIFILAAGQNLVVALFLRDHFAFDSAAALTAICLFKSAPLLLTCALLLRHRRELMASYRDAAWNGAAAAP